jgi:hypothetical protein
MAEELDNCTQRLADFDQSFKSVQMETAELSGAYRVTVYFYLHSSFSILTVSHPFVVCCARG